LYLNWVFNRFLPRKSYIIRWTDLTKSHDDDDDEDGDYIDEDSDDMDGFESIANASRISMGDLFSGNSPEGKSPDTGPSAVNSP